MPGRQLSQNVCAPFATFPGSEQIWHSPPDVLTSPTPQAVQSLWPSHPDAAVHSVPASHSDGALQLARSPETTFGARHS